MKKLLCVLAVFCLFGNAFALDVPPLTGHVNDLAGKLNPAQKTSLEAQLKAFEQATSNQIVLLVIPSLEGEDDVAYGVKVFKAWKLGQEKKDNGVLWINAIKERRNRIEVGYGLEGALPDATCKSILHNEVAPLFKADNFPQG